MNLSKWLSSRRFSVISPSWLASLLLVASSSSFAQTPTPNPSPSTSTTGSTSVQIACINSSGSSTVSSISCPAILSQCSDLKTSVETSVKKYLSWKIWGYYQGKNLDLNASTLNATSPVYVGTDLLYPICSVVGHTMQYSGTPPLKSGAWAPCDMSRATQNNAYAAAGIEYATQTIANKKSCGVRPTTQNSGNDVILQFANGAGSLWDSYLIGAYPWLIRRYAYDVLTAIKPDLSNIGDVITDTTIKADLVSLGAQMSGYYSSLGTDTTSSCSAAASSLVSSCANGTASITDASNRLCTLVKAEGSLNTGALPNIIVREIMSRVQTNYDLLFSTIMTFQKAPSLTLWGKCKDTGSLFRSVNRKNAMTASCLFDGGDFYSSGSKNTIENDCTGSSSRHASMPYITVVSSGDAQSFSAGNTGSDKTLLLGFGGVVESVIRRDICEQKNITDTSICDSINIPDKPAGVQ